MYGVKAFTAVSHQRATAEPHSSGVSVKLPEKKTQVAEEEGNNREIIFRNVTILVLWRQHNTTQT